MSAWDAWERRTRLTPRAPAARGLVAGVAGTAAMTVWQEVASRLEGSGESGGKGSEDPWESAPAPAQVAKRLIEGLFRRKVRADKIPLLTHVTHWGYGTAWRVVYGVLVGNGDGRPLRRGVVFGSGVWAMSYVQLVPMGIYEPPWKYPVKTFAEDLSYHLVYGTAVAAAWRLLDREGRSLRGGLAHC